MLHSYTTQNPTHCGELCTYCHGSFYHSPQTQNFAKKSEILWKIVHVALIAAKSSIEQCNQCQCFQTCFIELQAPSGSATCDKMTLLRQLGKLLRLSLDLLRAQTSMHFTALSLINRTIDISVLQQAHHPWNLQPSDAEPSQQQVGQ